MTALWYGPDHKRPDHKGVTGLSVVSIRTCNAQVTDLGVPLGFAPSGSAGYLRA